MVLLLPVRAVIKEDCGCGEGATSAQLQGVLVGGIESPFKEGLSICCVVQLSSSTLMQTQEPSTNTSVSLQPLRWITERSGVVLMI
ncbi:hypothetical protein BED46_027720 [Burkholderia contaminans]|nr:hypothetical protein [Burkholderia contaminans]MBA9841924.1 hypothetical protein [Burkholderia contaminans]MBA9866922.1 hypothetical protein [Burkholderia contaminans]MBA9909542.1 hypothetical protein [Burkholderia contaminans]MBA9933316.1 hypothetical protein [Burkholderia contaminans]